MRNIGIILNKSLVRYWRHGLLWTKSDNKIISLTKDYHKKFSISLWLISIKNLAGYTIFIFNRCNWVKYKSVFTFGLLNASSVHIIEGNMSTWIIKIYTDIHTNTHTFGEKGAHFYRYDNDNSNNNSNNFFFHQN